MSLFNLAWRNALRARSRTVITAAMVVLGTALLVVALTWIDGMFGGMMAESAGQLGHVRIVDADYAAREQLMPLYENLPDAAAVVAAAEAVDGVVEAVPILQAPVTVTAGEEIGEVFGLAVGADPDWIDRRMRVRGYVVEGSWFTGDGADVVIGRVLAERAGVRVGEELRLIGQTQDGAISPVLGNVVGIASAGFPLIDQRIFLSREKMEWLTDIPGGATEVLVYVDDYEADSDAVARRLRASPDLEGVTIQAWSEREPWTAFLGIIAAIRAILISTVVLITSLGVLNTMMMSVLERTNEIGVLRAMGLTRFGAVLLLVIEALTIAVVGGVLGAGLGAIGGWYLETAGIHIGDASQEMDLGIPFKTVMYGDLSPGILLNAFALGLAMALVGSVLPALRAASIEPVVAMRSER